MTKPMAEIQAEFDRIAQFSGEGGWDHNNHYHDFLLKHVTPGSDEVLEIGCGTGAFSRRLAQRAKHVLALDLSPEMIRIAKERSTEYRNIDFEVADVLQWEFPAERYDAIASIATLHHLPFDEMLLKMKRALRPGGVLLVLDLFQGIENFGDLARSAIAIPMSALYKLAKNGHVQDSLEARAAWDAHGQDDHYLRIPEVRRIGHEILPGAQITQHLFWRYSLVWKRS